MCSKDKIYFYKTQTRKCIGRDNAITENNTVMHQEFDFFPKLDKEMMACWKRGNVNLNE